MVNEQVCVLVIDDDAPSRRLFAAILGPRGYDVLEATTGQSGIDMARAVLPELIILDLGLPDMSGIQVALALKADQRTWDIPIITTTASPDSTGAAADERYCAGFAAKPIDYLGFLSTVKTVLDRRIASILVH
ncbi:MAG TPA: response regulator [Stellaceae bacterium]|nr:response regulator [Stellaceae bacterium]